MDSSSERVLITGASGFIGSKLMDTLSLRQFTPVGAFRCGLEGSSKDDHKIVGDLCYTNWSGLLGNIDVIIHCAARVHVMNEELSDPLSEFRKVNVDATIRLAREAAKAGVRRFIFLSSIKVNGEATFKNRPFTALDARAATDPYGVSKQEAEEGLTCIAKETGLEVVIIRPVLVYGPGVKANFQNLMYWINKGVPLPLGAVHNKRSMVGLDNLVDLIAKCIDHPDAANQTFLVSDGEDLSTTELLKRSALALGKPARLLPVPAVLLELAAVMLGKRALAQRICGSLQVDIRHTCETLGWKPPVSVDEVLKKTSDAFLAGR